MKINVRPLNGQAIRLSCIAVAAALITTQRSEAGMQEWFNAAGAQYNVTPGGSYDSANLRTVTGGGFVFKVPQKTFTPLGVALPQLRAGCGGIDFFSGAISLPSRAEFMNFLRGVGTAIPGLAFELALQSLSPDFSQKVHEYWTKFQEIANGQLTSCETADWLLTTTGAKKAIISEGKKVSSFLNTAAGGAADGAAAKLDSITSFLGWERRDANLTPSERRGIDRSTGAPGSVNQEGLEINLTWASLNSGVFASAQFTDTDREEIMSLIGPVVMRKLNPAAGDPNNTLEPITFKGVLDPIALMGSVDSTTVGTTSPMMTYFCRDSAAACLDVGLRTEQRVGTAQRVYDMARRIHRAIIDRDAAGVSQADIYTLHTITSVPLMALIQATSYRRFSGLSGQMLVVYSELAGYEIALNYSEYAIKLYRDLLKTVKDKQDSQKIIDHAEEQIKLLNVRLEELHNEGQKLQAKVQDVAAHIAFIEHIENRVRHSLTDELRQNMSFGQRSLDAE